MKHNLFRKVHWSKKFFFFGGGGLYNSTTTSPSPSFWKSEQREPFWKQDVSPFFKRKVITLNHFLYYSYLSASREFTFDKTALRQAGSASWEMTIESSWLLIALYKASWSSYSSGEVKWSWNIFKSLHNVKPYIWTRHDKYKISSHISFSFWEVNSESIVRNTSGQGGTLDKDKILILSSISRVFQHRRNTY